MAEEARLWRGLEEARVQEERRIDIKKAPKSISLPCCLSWQTSDLGLSEWEQLKLAAWLDLASQDQVTAASRSSKPVHQKHGHLVPTPGDWWPVPAVRAAKRRSRSCWMNWIHSTAEFSQPPPQQWPIHAGTRGRWSLPTNNPILSFLGCLRGSLV